jgi:hypothetical protein
MVKMQIEVLVEISVSIQGAFSSRLYRDLQSVTFVLEIHIRRVCELSASQ